LRRGGIDVVSSRFVDMAEKLYWAAGLAGATALSERLAGKCVAIIVSGGSIDLETLRRVISREIA